MIAGILKVVGTEVLKNITSQVLKNIKTENFQTEKKTINKLHETFSHRYGSHFDEICRWANSIPFIGLTNPKKTNISTIELMIASNIRTSKNSNIIHEVDILNSNDNILLVGAPGAGKTTTLKRLILRYVAEFSNLQNLPKSNSSSKRS
jgi:flagellar biosynthesis GTPase FlhF